MRDTLWDDAARLALNEAIANDSSFIDSITIPEPRIQCYYKDLANLYNARSISARDSIFLFYPFRPEIHFITVFNSIDTELVPDSTLLQLQMNFHLQPGGDRKLLWSPIACNAIALGDEMQHSYPNLRIAARGVGTGGWCLSDVFVSDSTGFRFYTFRYCMGSGSHDWYFSVNDADVVHYLGNAGDNVK
jgi:hypothetical protein